MSFKKDKAGRVLRVLYLDDKAHDQNHVVNILQQQNAGFDVTAIATRGELEALLSDGGWDAVLTDVNIVGLAGRDVIDIVTESVPGVPVLVVNGNGAEEAAVELLRREVGVKRLPATIRSAVENAERREALLRTRKMLEHTERIAHVGSWEWEIATDTVWWSREQYRILGYDPELPPPSFAEHASLFENDDFERLSAAVAAAVSDGVAYELELNAVTKTGEVRRVLASGSPTLRVSGKVPYLYGTLQDITELRRAERALRDRDRQYRALVDNTRDIIWATDLDLTFTYVNPSVERLMGYTPDEFIGTNVRDYCDEALFTRLQEVLAAQLTLDPDEVGVVIEVPLRCKDGSLLSLEVSATLVCDDHAAPLYIQGASRDVSERAHMQSERERLMQAVRQVGETVVITDIHGVIEYANPEFERVTGYSAEEALGRNAGFLSDGDENRVVYEELWTTISSGRTWEGRFKNRRKDGTRFVEAATISPVSDSSGEIANYVAVKRDITRELELETQLHQASKMEAIGRLAGGVAHDFNNMLGVILGYARQAEARIGPDDPIHGDLKEIMLAAERSAELTRRLLGFARKQTVAPQVIDLNSHIENTLGMLRRMVREDIDLQWNPGPKVPPVEIDTSQLDQILANLVVNARDAIAGGGKVSIETGAAELDDEYCGRYPGARPGHFSRLTVSDDGSGMDRQTLSQIFEPFYTTKETSGGTGLGMATTYGIVKQNNGFINVYSEPGVGTTVNIYFVACAAGSARPIQPKKMGTSRGTETVLLVEDEPALLELSAILLQNLGYRVLPANRPRLAVELAREHAGSIDLLMTDVVMPGMNGGDLWEEIRVSNPGMKCLFVSGYPADVIHERGRLDEGVNFLQKPFVLESLAEKLREVLDN